MNFAWKLFILEGVKYTYQIWNNIHKWIPLIQEIIKFCHLQKAQTYYGQLSQDVKALDQQELLIWERCPS